jgi:ATP-binding cassette subfamily B protein
MNSAQDSLDRWALIRQLLQVARPCRLQLAGIFLLNLIAAPISLLLAFPLKIVVDSVIGRQPLPHFLRTFAPATTSKSANLVIAAGLLLVLSMALNLQAYASWLLQTWTGEKLVLDFRSRLFWHAQRMELLFHDRRGMNDLSYRIQYDAAAVQYIFIQGAIPLLSSALSFLAMLYVTMRIDSSMAAIALVLAPVMFLLARKSGRRARDGWDGIKKLDSSAMLVLQETLSHIRAVKAFSQEQFEDQRFRLRSRQRMAEQVRVASTQALFHVLITTALACGTAAALFIGVRHVDAGVITLGDLLLVMAYMAQLYEPLRSISGKLPELQTWLVSIRRALALLEGAPELIDSPNPAPADRVAGDITFCGVSFAYPSSGRALDNVSFTILAGTRVGIIGASGSGKSTLVNLLTRFYDPGEGQVLLDQRDLRNYSLASLRQQFSIMLQEPVVFSATIAENISYGRPDASRDEIMEAARRASAHMFITALPQGYDTPVGDGGCRLSGGQRQRLAIARAFLKDAPVLIFDEPTSAVDLQTEQEIMRATEKLMRGRTTLIVAHRLSTIRNCDLLLVLRKGTLRMATTDFKAAIREITEPSSYVEIGNEDNPDFTLRSVH